MAKDLKTLLKNKFTLDTGLAIKVANKVGLSNASALYKFVNETDRELASFDILLRVVEEVFDCKDVKPIMKSYCKTLKPNCKTARRSLEYAIMNQMPDLLESMLKKLESSSNKESQEWAKVYRYEQQRREGIVNKMNIVDDLYKEQDKIKTPEMKFFSKIVQYYCYYNLRQIDIMKQIMINSEGLVDKITDEYIFNSYLSRLKLIQLDVDLHTGKTNEAIELGEFVISNSCQKNLVFLAHLQVGNANITRSLQTAVHHYSKALSLCEELKITGVNLQLVKRGLNFVNSYWGKKAEYLDLDSRDISDIHEVAFNYISEGNSTRGIQILDSINHEEMSSYQLGFHHFYRGLATKEKKYFYQSVEHFNSIGEKFYKQISITELAKMGENQFVLNALSV
jgi:hypothetical protein